MKINLIQQIMLVSCSAFFCTTLPLTVSAETNQEIRQLREQLADQTRRIDRLFDALGPELAQMEKRAAELKKQQADDAALAMHEVFRSRDEAFNSKLMFVPGSRCLAVAYDDGAVKLLRLPKGEIVAAFNGLDGDVECLASSADGSRIFAGTRPGSVFVSQGNSTNAQRIFDWTGSPVTALVASPDGTRIVCACNGKHGANGAWGKPPDSLLAVEAATGKKLWAGNVGRADFQALSFAGDGKTIAVVQSGLVKILDGATGSTLHELTHSKYASGPLSTALSADGKLCAVGYAPNDIGIWDVNAGRCLRLLGAHHNWVVSLVFSPNGSLLASSSGDTTASVWDFTTGKEVGRLRFGDGNSYVNCVSISDDGRWLAAGRKGEFVVLEMPKKSTANE